MNATVAEPEQEESTEEVMTRVVSMSQIHMGHLINQQLSTFSDCLQQLLVRFSSELQQRLSQSLDEQAKQQGRSETD